MCRREVWMASCGDRAATWNSNWSRLVQSNRHRQESPGSFTAPNNADYSLVAPGEIKTLGWI